MSLIKDYCIKEIETKGDIVEVIRPFVKLKRSGANHKGDCPFCNGKEKFSINPKKNLWKCFSCDAGGSGYLTFVKRMKNFSWPEVWQFMAGELNIVLEYEEDIKPMNQKPAPKPSEKKAPKQLTFRDEQLKASGLDESDQKFKRQLDTGGKDDYAMMDRYQSATINKKWEIVPGDDMILHYMNLDGRPMTYQKERSTKDHPLIRVRWSNPNLHLDKKDKPIKYQSPYGSTNAVWINEVIRDRFQKRLPIKSLFVTEGEKKADKATKHDIYSIGVMGIHNVAHEKQLAPEFQWIIKNCDTENVIFFVDADWNDLGESLDKGVDYRPRTFFSAVRNFRDYFYAFNNVGISLNIYFAFPNPEHGQKGLDDLLTNVLAGKEDLLKKDIDAAMISSTGEGKYVTCHKITSIGDFKLKEYFFLDNLQNFVDHHKDKLKDKKMFVLGGEKYKFSNLVDNPDLPAGTLMLAMPLEKDEEYWDEEIIERKSGPKTILRFNHTRCYRFLNKRNFGRLKFKGTGTRYIRIDGNIVSEIEHSDIRDFVVDFTENKLEKANLLESLYRAAQHLGPISLTNLKFITPQFPKSMKGLQYLYFGETFWRINAEGIKEEPLNNLAGHVWQDKLIDFNAKRMEPLVKVTSSKVDGKNIYDVIFPDGATKPDSDFLAYLWNASNFFWEQTGEGYAQKKDPSGKLRRNLDDFEIYDQKLHFISKLSAIGYLLHSHYDDATRKMVIAMDGKQSEVGKSNGRTGKSLLGRMLKHVVPVVVINGKKKDLAEDRFVFGKVTEKTNIVFIDDMRVNVDIEFFFNYITGEWDVQEKGQISITIPENDSPKILGTTNHALNGEGGSFRARLHFIAFSDFYSENHSPQDEHGCLFYKEWDYDQKNAFFNAIGCCLQIYFEHGLVNPPMELIEDRRLRQQLGETFLDWANQYFDPERKSGVDGLVNLDRQILRSEMTEDFYSYDLNNKKYTDIRKFKEKIKQYCAYKKYVFNPLKDGEDHKSNGQEYFTVARSKTSMKDETPF